MNYLASGVGAQLTSVTNFLHTVPAIGAFLASLVLFLVLAKSERLGGLSFRHIIFALAYGIFAGALFIPPSLNSQLSALTKPGANITAFVVFFAIIVIEIIMIVRDRRKGGGVIE